MYSGFTYASGLAADKDGNICNAAANPTTCIYRHCVTWTTKGDDQCFRKDVVCGDAYASSPTTTVLMLGGAYTLGSNGEQQTLINSCFTKSGDLVPNGTKRNKDATTTETCVDGVWTTQDKLIAANNKLCEERYPGQGYEYNENYSMCMFSSTSEVAKELNKTLIPTSSITDEKNWSICASKPGAQWNNGECECKAGFALTPTKSQCVSTKLSCTEGSLSSYVNGRWNIKACESGQCNLSGTACSPTATPAGSYSTFQECATGITPDMRVVCRESTDGKGNKYFYRVPYEIVSTKLSATLYDSEKQCRIRLPSTQDCVPISGSPGKFGRVPKVTTSKTDTKLQPGDTCYPIGSPETDYITCSNGCPFGSERKGTALDSGYRCKLQPVENVTPPLQQQGGGDEVLNDRAGNAIVGGSVGAVACSLALSFIVTPLAAVPICVAGGVISGTIYYNVPPNPNIPAQSEELLSLKANGELCGGVNIDDVCISGKCTLGQGSPTSNRGLHWFCTDTISTEPKEASLTAGDLTYDAEGCGVAGADWVMVEGGRTKKNIYRCRQAYTLPLDNNNP